jgi:excisionase family DNA binding protein
MITPTKESTPSDRETYLTVKETAAFLKISPVTVWRLLGDGKLKKFKCGARTLIRLRDAEGLVREA